MSNRRQNQIKAIGENIAKNLEANRKAYQEAVQERDGIDAEMKKAIQPMEVAIAQMRQKIGHLEAEVDEISKPFIAKMRESRVNELSQAFYKMESEGRRLEYLRLLEKIEDYQKQGYVIERLKHPVSRGGTDEFFLGQMRGRSNFCDRSHVLQITLSSGEAFSILTDNASKPWSLPTSAAFYPDVMQVTLSKGIRAVILDKNLWNCPICSVATNEPEKHYNKSRFEGEPTCIHAKHLVKEQGKLKKVKLTWKVGFDGAEFHVENTCEEFEE
jgi:flagellar biosynthesis chaperone FliJ